MKRVGLFIGIDNYKNGISKLQCAVNDAKSLSFAFNKAGFTSELMQNEECSCDNILTKMQEVTAGLNSGDIFLFYFSGHGREVGGSHYLVGATGHASSALYTVGSVQLAALIEFTNRIPGLNRFFILDCCRSNLLADRAGTFVCSNARDLALESAVAPDTDQSIIPPLILSSCSTGEQAFEDSLSRHGFFTKTLLDSISNSEIHSFRQFRESLRISGTPAPQNVSWNGDPDRWEKVLFLDRWTPKAAAPEVEMPKADPLEIIKYQTKALYEGVQELMANLSIPCPPEAKINFKAAEDAATNGDFSTALHLLQLVKESVENAIADSKRPKMTQAVSGASPVIPAGSEWEKAFADGLSFNSDNTILLSAPQTLSHCIVPPGVIKIADRAFYGCENLKSVKLPEGVVEIGEKAFKGCKSLPFCNFPQSLQVINDSAFEDCISLHGTQLPQKLLRLGSRAFANSRISTLKIPDSIESIGKEVSDKCRQLLWIRCPKSLEWRRTEIFTFSVYYLSKIRRFFIFFLATVFFIIFFVLLTLAIALSN